jgi:hypothetical protein
VTITVVKRSSVRQFLLLHVERELVPGNRTMSLDSEDMSGFKDAVTWWQNRYMVGDVPALDT